MDLSAAPSSAVSHPRTASSSSSDDMTSYADCRALPEAGSAPAEAGQPARSEGVGDDDLDPREHGQILRLVRAGNAAELSRALARPGGHRAASEIRDKRGGTIGHIAAESGTAEVLALLAERQLAGLRLVDQDGALPLHRALGWDEVSRRHTPTMLAEAVPGHVSGGSHASVEDIIASEQGTILGSAFGHFLLEFKPPAGAMVAAILEAAGDQKGSMVQAEIPDAGFDGAGDGRAQGEGCATSCSSLKACPLTLATLHRDVSSLDQLLAHHPGGVQMRHAMLLDGFFARYARLYGLLSEARDSRIAGIQALSTLSLSGRRAPDLHLFSAPIRDLEAAGRQVHRALVKTMWQKRPPGEPLSTHVVRTLSCLGAVGDWEAVGRVLTAMSRAKRRPPLSHSVDESESVLAVLLRSRAPIDLLQSAIDIGAPVDRASGGSLHGPTPLLLAAGLSPACREASLLFTNDLDLADEESDVDAGGAGGPAAPAPHRESWLAELAWGLSHRLDFRDGAVAALITAGADPFETCTETLTLQWQRDSSLLQDFSACHNLLSLAVLAGARDTVRLLLARPEAARHPEILANAHQIGLILHKGLGTATARGERHADPTEAANAAFLADQLLGPGQQERSAYDLLHAQELLRAFAETRGLVQIDRDEQTVAACLAAHLDTLEEMSWPFRSRRSGDRTRVFHSAAAM